MSEVERERRIDGDMSPCTKAFTQLRTWRDARTAIRRRLHTHAERDKGHTHHHGAHALRPSTTPLPPPSQPHPHPPPHSLSTTTPPPRATQLQHSSNKIFIFFSFPAGWVRLGKRRHERQPCLPLAGRRGYGRRRGVGQATTTTTGDPGGGGRARPLCLA